MKLTPREAETLDFIRTHLKAYGIPPATHEICIALRLSPGSRALVSRYIDALVAKGRLRRLARRARGIELVHPEHDHAHECNCAGCSDARYQRGLKLVEALQVVPEATLASKLVGLRPLSHLTRLEWLRPTNDRRKPRLSRAKAVQDIPHHDSFGAA